MTESQRAFYLKESVTSLVYTGVRFMRCFFVKANRIAGVEMLPGLSDQEAIAKAQRLFSLKHPGEVEGFEVWDHTRVVFRHPDPYAATLMGGRLTGWHKVGLSPVEALQRLKDDLANATNLDPVVVYADDLRTLIRLAERGVDAPP